MSTNHPFIKIQFPVPWAELTPEQAKIDIKLAMTLLQERIDAISNLTDEQINYASVFTAYDDCDIELDQGYTFLNHLTSVHDNEKLRSLYK